MFGATSANASVLPGAPGIVKTMNQIANDRFEIIVYFGAYGGVDLAGMITTSSSAVGLNGSVNGPTRLGAAYSNLERLFDIPSLNGQYGTFVQLATFNPATNQVIAIINPYNYNGMRFKLDQCLSLLQQ